MSAYTGQLECLRCGYRVADPALEVVGRGCPKCADSAAPANMLATYDLRGRSGLRSDAAQPGLFRYRDLLPLGAATVPVSLHEGNTPLIPAAPLARRIGAAQLMIKDESRNPTWSYKDRLAAVAVTKAVELGIDTVVVSSTGNHGAAVAAYAARAGLQCVVLTLATVPTTMKTLMQVYGAHVVALNSGPERWALMAQLVHERGWFPISGYADPPVGSNPYGVDGYKTIAYEVVDQLAGAPDVVALPVAYADGLVGVARGFDDLLQLGVITKVPRMVAAEAFGAHAHAMATGDDRAGPVPAGPSVAFSIASPVGTYQGLSSLRTTNGQAVAVPDDDVVLAAQTEIGATTGLFLEAAAAITLPALDRFASGGNVRPDDTVVLIATSTGLKDPASTATMLPGVPLIEASPQALDRAVADLAAS